MLLVFSMPAEYDTKGVLIGMVRERAREPAELKMCGAFEQHAIELLFHDAWIVPSSTLNVTFFVHHSLMTISLLITCV